MKLLPIIFLIASFLAWPLLVQADVLPACTTTGNCGLCDFLDTFINIIRWLLGVVGGSALFLIVWHAFGWITAGGNKERIESVRKALIHTVIGLAIIIISWQLVNIVIVLLVNPPGGTSAGLFKDNQKIWYAYCTGVNQCQGRGNGSPCDNGNFCLNQKCTGKDTTGHTDACQFWSQRATSTKEGFLFNPYTQYNCRAKSLCDPYENLGPDYCSQIPNQGEQNCCKGNVIG